jgi:hypothetical protein
MVQILLGKSELGGGGSIASTQRPTNSYVNLQGDYNNSILWKDLKCVVVVRRPSSVVVVVSLYLLSSHVSSLVYYVSYIMNRMITR